MTISREAFFDKFSVKDAYKDVVIGGETIRLKKWTGAERGAFEAHCNQHCKDEQSRIVNVRAIALAFSVVGEDGQRVFSNADIHTINDVISGDVLDVLYDELLRYNKLTATDIEALEKN